MVGDHHLPQLHAIQSIVHAIRTKSLRVRLLYAGAGASMTLVPLDGVRDASVNEGPPVSIERSRPYARVPESAADEDLPTEEIRTPLNIWGPNS